jgi:hypothetical protein
MRPGFYGVETESQNPVIGVQACSKTMGWSVVGSVHKKVNPVWSTTNQPWQTPVWTWPASLVTLQAWPLVQLLPRQQFWITPSHRKPLGQSDCCWHVTAQKLVSCPSMSVARQSEHPALQSTHHGVRGLKQVPASSWQKSPVGQKLSSVQALLH